jgi:thymidylate kinase
VSIGVEIAEAIDSIVTEPVLVVGSAPPTGHDLDLLASGPGYDAITGWLTGAGFLQWRESWARLDGAGTYGVELFRAEDWFPGSAAHTLLQDAQPIPGLRHLVRPGPVAELLLAARGIVVHRGGLTEKSRARVTRALEQCPQAWRTAEAQAPRLGLPGALRLLRRAYESERPLSPHARAAGLVGLWAGDGALSAKARVVLQARPPRVRPVVVSFSGLDGSGKSTQVAMFRKTLDQVGVSSTVQWAGFATGWRLHKVGAFLGRVTTRRSRRGAMPGKARPRLREARPGVGPDPFVPVGWEDPLRQQMWVGVVAVVNAVKQWTYVLKPRRGAKVLIFDRFTPDSAVKLDFFYESERNIAVSWQRSLFNRISPKPDVGFLVKVPAEVAFARAGEWEPEQLATMARLYDQQVHPFRLVRLDGTEPPEELARQVAVAAWQGMR